MMHVLREFKKKKVSVASFSSQNYYVLILSAFYVCNLYQSSFSNVCKCITK